MLEIIIYTLLISTILNVILKKFGIPTIIGYITTGTIIAYGFNLHDAVHNESLKVIAEFGIVFLMFTIGLEFSVDHLMKMKKEVFVYGASQVIVTSIVFFLFAHYLFDIANKSAIIIALALALSSTAIVLKVLNENGDISKPYGKKVLGVLLFQDIAVIPILLMVTIFSSEGKSISSLLTETFINAAILLIGLYIIGKYVLESLLLQVAKTKSNEIFISSILLFVISTSYLAHVFGFSYSLGAFIAGMMIAETHYKHQVEADLIPFRDLLLGVFFITVGMQINFTLIYENIGIILLLIPLLTIIKVAIIFAIMRFTSTKSTALKTAISIFQLGEFGLVILELSFANNLIDPTVGQIIIVTIVLSMIMTPFLLKNLSKIVELFDKKDVIDKDKKKIEMESLENHIVLIGYGRLGRNIANLLEENDKKYIAIEGNIKRVMEYEKQGVNIIYGDASKKDILKSANIDAASAVIVSIGNSEQLTHICEVVKDLAQDRKTVVKVNTYEERKNLEKLRLSHIIVETEKTAKAMYFEAITLKDE
jgi:CPA2 family monovalent cation:H+ antiporter-2